MPSSSPRRSGGAGRTGRRRFDSAGDGDQAKAGPGQEAVDAAQQRHGAEVGDGRAVAVLDVIGRQAPVRHVLEHQRLRVAADAGEHAGAGELGAQLGVGADGLLEHQLLVGAPQQGGGVQAEGVAQQAEVEGDLLVDAVDGALGELELVDLAAAGGGVALLGAGVDQAEVAGLLAHALELALDAVAVLLTQAADQAAEHEQVAGGEEADVAEVIDDLRARAGADDQLERGDAAEPGERDPAGAVDDQQEGDERVDQRVGVGPEVGAVGFEPTASTV